jgi:hypothetical protein
MLLGLIGCSSQPSKDSDNPDPAAESAEDPGFEKETNQAISPTKATSQATREIAPIRMKPLSFSTDGFPKAREYFKENLKVKTEYDFNGDGRIDFVENYSDDGLFVSSEASDLDGDGILEVISHYERSLKDKSPVLSKQEVKTQGSNSVNVWKYYDGNQLIRREIDRRGKGRPDFWEYYEKGNLARIEKDENGDGQPDSNPSFRKLVSPEGPEPSIN